MPVPTPFHARTSKLCTSLRWKDWAGFYAVCTYDTVQDREYFAFRHASGLLDISPLFKYDISGPDAVRLLSWILTRDIGKLKPGQVSYSCFCDEEGKLIDDGTVTRLEETRFRVTSASPSLRWFQVHSRGFQAKVEDRSEAIAALALQGPTSRSILEEATGREWKSLRFFRCARAEIGGKTVEISRTGYTGDLGYEIWIPAVDALPVWDRLIEIGPSYGLEPAGLDALDVTRIEAGFVLHGVDYYSAPRCLIEARKSSPFEMGLGWTVELDRDPFVGQQALRKEKEQGAKWRLVGLDISWEDVERLHDEHGLPPHLPAEAWRTPVPVYSGGRQIGRATSGAWSPILKRNLALATVESGFSRLGTSLEIEQTVEYSRKTARAVVSKRPFFNPERKRA